MADWVILEILASWINWLFRLVKWEILPVLPSWELSGEGILANKALGPGGPRALLASIPTPLNLQLGNIDTAWPSNFSFLLEISECALFSAY